MTKKHILQRLLIFSILFLMSAVPALAEDPIPNKGDTSFMILSTLLVVMMAVPGLALFYGGMVRSKNMLSIFIQVMCVFCLCGVLWIFVGYSLAFTDGGSLQSFIGGFDKVFLTGIGTDSTAATFTDGVVIPEFVFIAFQLTFASITPALIVGAMAERAKFSAVMVFSVLWFFLSYLPIAHMVWSGDGALLFDLGAFDFAGGLVVHMNAGVAGLVVACLLGPRLGYGRESLAPHSLPLTLTGACLLWVGWFGFNAGSNLEADGLASLALLNTLVATAGATLAWVFIEMAVRGKGSALGAASGAIAGLVAITPAAGFAGPAGAILLGVVASVICYVFVTSIKVKLGYDDSLDCFGIHGVGGIVGALGTALVDSTALGGQGTAESVSAQFLVQAESTVIALIWCVVATLIAYFITKIIVGFRVSEDNEREGLDLSEHGERAYSS